MTGFQRRTPVRLLKQTRVTATGAGDAVESFADAAAVTVTVNVKQSNAVASGSIALLVEHSADGDSWETLADLGTVADPSDSLAATVADPNVFLRLSWTVSGAAVWYVDGMAVTFEDYPAGGSGGGGGGSLPTGWTQEFDPAAVDMHGGQLNSTEGGRVRIEGGAGTPSQMDGSGFQQDDGGDGFVSMSVTDGIFSAPNDAGSPAFSADGAGGAVIAFDGGGLPAKNLAEGTDPSDAATVSQLGGSLPYPDHVVVQAGNAGLFTDAISAEPFSQQLLYTRVDNDPGGTNVKQLRAYKFQTLTDVLLATDNFNGIGQQYAAEADINSTTRLAYPTDHQTVKVIDFDGTVLAETADLGGSATWVNWQYNAAFDDMVILASLLSGDVLLINPDDGTHSTLMTVGGTGTYPTRCSQRDRTIAYFESGVLKVADPDGSNQTAVSGAPAASDNVWERPEWAYSTPQSKDFIYYATGSGAIEATTKDGATKIEIASGEGPGSRRAPRVLGTADGNVAAHIFSPPFASFERLVVGSGEVSDRGYSVFPFSFAFNPAWLGGPPTQLAFGYELAPDNFDAVGILNLSDVINSAPRA